MGDNIWLEDRNSVRTPMQWDKTTNAGFSSPSVRDLYTPIIESAAYKPEKVSVQDQISDNDSLLNKIKYMISVRKCHEAFCCNTFKWVDLKNDHTASYNRENGGETILIINNLSSSEQTINLNNTQITLSNYSILLYGNGSINLKDQTLVLKPYQFIWMLI